MSYQHIERVETSCEKCTFALKEENKQVGCKADQLNTTYKEETGEDGNSFFVVDKICGFFRSEEWNNGVADVEKAKNQIRFKPLVIIDADEVSIEEIGRLLYKDAAFRLIRGTENPGPFLQFVKDKVEQYDVSVEFVLGDKTHVLIELIKKEEKRFPVFILHDGGNQVDIKEMTELAILRFTEHEPFLAVVKDCNVLTFSAIANDLNAESFSDFVNDLISQTENPRVVKV